MSHPLSMILCLFLFVCAPGAAFAGQTLVTAGADGRPFLQFDIYDEGEISVDRDGVSAASAWTPGSGYLRVMKNAADYWGALWGTSPANSAPARIVVRTLDAPNFAAIQTLESASGRPELAELLLNNTLPSGDGSAATLLLGDFDPEYSGPLSLLPAGGYHGASLITHELGHAMGIMTVVEQPQPLGPWRFTDKASLWNRHLADSFGNRARPGLAVVQGTRADPDAFVVDSTGYYFGGVFFAPGGYAFFQGPNTMEALGGPDAVLMDLRSNTPGTVPGLPLNGFEPDELGNPFPDLSHLELRNSLMSHQSYRNWGTLMEAELAVLEDIGLPVDRKNFFGHSIYTDSGTHDLSLGFYARNALGNAYYEGRYNSSPLTVGLHLYGTGNTVRAGGESLASGYGGVGVRVDGWENRLTLTPQTRVHSLGENGTGLMVAYGVRHRVIQQGEILAGGVGARFDFGSNIMSDFNEYRGSYIHTGFDGDSLWHIYLTGELNGPLVENFDLSGPLGGREAAIYISENAHVANINIMNGARLWGDIVSRWDPQNPLINPDLRDEQGNLLISPTTDLSFGLTPDADGKATATADADFFLDYRGGIRGEKSLNLRLEGGALAYGGTMDVLSFTAKSGSSLLAVPNADGVLISAPDIALESGSAVGLYTGGVGYGAPLAANQPVLRLEGGNIRNKATPEVPSGPFIHGFYDYTPLSLDWKGQNLMLQSRRALSQERAATSALTASTAIMARSPHARLFHDRAAGIFSRTVGDTNSGAVRNVSSPPIGEARRNAVSLWVTPSYGNAGRYGAKGYTLDAPGLALGGDRPVGESAFIGAGAYLSRPAYRSDDADLDAESYTGLIYGGTRLPFDLELDAFAAFGHANYEQRRSVHGEGYGTEYSGEHLGAGLSLGRSFALGAHVAARPFASYEIMHLNVDGYDEGESGLFGLEAERNRSTLHRLQVGTGLSYTLDKGFVEGTLFYSGLYGDRQPQAGIRMTRDPSGYTMRSKGWAEDEHAAGIGLNFGLNLGDAARLSGGYSFVGGKRTAGHTAEMTLSFTF